MAHVPDPEVMKGFLGDALSHFEVVGVCGLVAIFDHVHPHFAIGDQFILKAVRVASREPINPL